MTASLQLRRTTRGDWIADVQLPCDGGVYLFEARGPTIAEALAAVGRRVEVDCQDRGVDTDRPGDLMQRLAESAHAELRLDNERTGQESHDDATNAG